MEIDFATMCPSHLKRREAAAMTRTMNRKMNTMMTAACAGAASCCACAASHTVILSVLGAIIRRPLLFALCCWSSYWPALRIRHWHG